MYNGHQITLLYLLLTLALIPTFLTLKANSSIPTITISQCTNCAQGHPTAICTPC